MTDLIDGRAIAREWEAELAAELRGQPRPGLAALLVGEDPASRIYVDRKRQACERVGIDGRVQNLPSNASQSEVTGAVTALGRDPSVHGILVQLPLPSHLDTDAVLAAIPPAKDVDGLTVQSQGSLALGQPGLRPCTPAGIMRLLAAVGFGVSGKRVVVVGRSRLVGAPIARLLDAANGTVTTIHSRTLSPAALAREADLLVVAAGKPQLVDEAWVKPGATVIDVGIHRTDAGLVGDVDQARVVGHAGALTPVPGGVGPLTIAALLANCVAACRLAG